MKLTVEASPVVLDSMKAGKSRLLQGLTLLLALFLIGFYFWQNGMILHLWQDYVAPREKVDHRIRHTTKGGDTVSTPLFNIDDYAVSISNDQFRDSLSRSKHYERNVIVHVIVGNTTVLTIYKPTKNDAYSDLSDMLALGAIKVMGEWPGSGNYVLTGRYMANPKLLFTPLQTVAIGQIITIAAEGDREWRYQVTKRQILTQGDTVWQKNLGNKPLLTLVTSDSPRPGSTLRLMVQGELYEEE